MIVMALLTAGRLEAGEGAGTNTMPASIRNLMETKGYTIDLKKLIRSEPDTNSLRNLPSLDQQQFPLLEVTTNKPGWSLWRNSDFKSVGRRTDQINLLTPASALSQYEYDITYTFIF